jgi:hypothetical protein
MFEEPKIPVNPELLSRPYLVGCCLPACLQQVVALCLSQQSSCLLPASPELATAICFDLRQTLSLFRAELHRNISY